MQAHVREMNRAGRVGVSIHAGGGVGKQWRDIFEAGGPPCICYNVIVVVCRASYFTRPALSPFLCSYRRSGVKVPSHCLRRPALNSQIWLRCADRMLTQRSILSQRSSESVVPFRGPVAPFFLFGMSSPMARLCLLLCRCLVLLCVLYCCPQTSHACGTNLSAAFLCIWSLFAS